MSKTRINAKRRRELRQWILDIWGDGTNVDCEGCGISLNYETMTMDRYPICGWDGGTYQRSNVRPLCWTCNNTDGIERVKEREKHSLKSRLVWRRG